MSCHGVMGDRQIDIDQPTNQNFSLEQFLEGDLDKIIECNILAENERLLQASLQTA